MESFGTWILNFLNTYVVGFGINLIFALIILLVGFKLVKVLITLVQKAKWYQKLDVNVQSFCGNFFSVLLKILIIIVVVDIIGVPSASLIAVLGSAGVAIGLALQGGLSNIAGGVIIMFCRPFHVGDFIITGAGSGVVQDIGIYYTKITTPDNQDIVLPNSTLTSSPITNLSTQETRRLDFDFSVAYSTDIDLARKVLLAAAQNNDLVLKDLKLVKEGKVKLLVNRAPGGVLAEGVEELIRESGMELIGVLPQDEAVYECDGAGKPTAFLPKDNPVKKALYEALDKITF